ncbi:uncharacterized protein LOC109853792 isoform X4 [Pseudomyrmex gracilis]|uniref:uncharacterized protein LOC109853792 isoform X4 n=1 Tax=Pseudomyrmex gracilis TaxID=219809 RepID=UPI0009953AD1|nr:uncharacterized protein LOC109853792 isoform X4 [Pseudomyrmex gracilis]
MKSILITGCNRGLGLGLVKHLIELAKPPEFIFATCRDTSKATELRALADKSPNVHIIEIDLTDTANYTKVVNAVAERVKGTGLNVLFNNAGISSKFTRLGLVKQEQITDALLINTVAPILLTKAFLPLLKAAAKNAADKTGLSVRRAAVVNMTSILASIAQNNDGGFYPYRCSKTALNAATKSMSVDLKPDGILAVCLHPGWVRTDLGGSNAPMDVDSSVSQILNTMNSLTEKHTGCFVQYDGKTLPW